MASINCIKPGQTLWTVTSRTIGNTIMRGKVVHKVLVKEVNVEKGTVIASWNNNPDRKYYERQIKQWKVNKPKVKETSFR